jgi:cell wall assembly regulator SMI1
MQDIWKRIEKSLRDVAPAALGTLSAGASAKVIGSAEKALGITFPQEVIESYRVHDGQSDAAPELFDGWRLLPMDRVVAEWTVWKKLLDGGEFKGRQSDAAPHHVSDWWNPAWIPLTSNGAGDHHCLDLAPGRGGRSGQIIQMQHDGPERALVADSFRQWLADRAEELSTTAAITTGAPKSSGAAVAMEDLARLVGRTLRDADVKAFLATQTVVLKRDPDFGEHALINKPAGYEITYGKGDRIQTVFIHIFDKEGRRLFGGPLIRGLAADDGHTEVRKRLGVPTRSGGLEPSNPTPQGGWDCYDEPETSIHFGYRKDRKGIGRITVMSPDTAPGRAKPG